MEKFPAQPTSARLEEFWNKPVSDLVQLELPSVSADEAERHRIFCLLLAALVHDNWNGNIWGPDGDYPWREKQKVAPGHYRGGGYQGHNIAAIAVTKDGRVIDFDFNHNDLFQSSIEHAESRLVRRLFNLNEVRRAWTDEPMPAAPVPRRSDDYAGLLADVTIYTSLESCAQCAGIMTLASARSVVFLQSDPGQYGIGNILYNLAPSKNGKRYHAPLPIPARAFGLPYFDELDVAYKEFQAGVKARYFYKSETREDHSAAISSFLCTDAAMDIYARATTALEALTPAYDANKPLLTAAKSFRAYARIHGFRGTPH